MAEKISIVMSLQDQMSPTLKALAGNAKAFDKTLEELEKATQAYGRSQEQMVKQSAALKKGLEEANVKVAQARKEYRRLKDEASKGALDAAIEEQQRLKWELDETTTAMKANARGYRDLTANARKAAQEQGRLERTGGDGAEGSLANLPKSAGLLKMLGDSLSQAANAGIESYLGQPAASLVSGTLSGAASGAVMGSIAGLPGAAIGAVIGGFSGLVSAQTQTFKEEDEAFKAYYKGIYEEQAAAMDEAAASGAALAGSRETTQISFETLLGTEEAARGFLGDVLNTANTTPFLYDDLVGISKTLLTFGYAAEDIIPTLTKVGDAGAALGLSTGDIGTAATYIGRMRSSDKASLEYLNPLNEWGFSVFQWLAEAQGVTQKEVYDMISKGELSGTYVSQLILDKFEELYGGMMAQQSLSYEGRSSTLQGLQENIQAAGGEGYNALRQESMAQDIAAYGGALGEEMQAAYRAIGAGRAALENLGETYTRDARTVVLKGGELTQDWNDDVVQDLIQLHGEYLTAMEAYEQGDESAGIEVERILEATDGLAQQQYEASGLYQQNLDAQAETLTTLMENTAAVEASTAAYELALESTKGSIAGQTFFGIKLNASPEELDAWVKNMRDQREKRSSGRHKRAFGQDRVPYDDYPALLHEGERVLTASQARQMDRGAGGASVQVSVGTLVVREEADLEKIAHYLMEEAKIRRMAGEYEGAAGWS